MKKFLPFLLIVILFSCQKDDVDNTSGLISKSWKMTGWTILTPFQGTPLEGYSNNWYSAGTCYSDMLWTYKNDGTFINEPAGSCVPGTANGIDTLYGKWSLLNDNKVIKVVYTGGGFADFEFKIIELTPMRMVVQRVERTGIGSIQAGDFREIDLLNQFEFKPK